MLTYNTFLNENRRRDSSDEKYNVYYYNKKLMEEMEWLKIDMKIQFDGLYRIIIESTPQSANQSWNDNTWTILMDQNDVVYLHNDFVEKFKQKFIKEFSRNPVRLKHFPKWLGNAEQFFKQKQFDL